MTILENVAMKDEECKSVYTLNTWHEDTLREAYELLESGYWVRFGSTCIGHTMAKIVENEGIDLVREKYGEENVIEAKREGWGYWYVKLK